MTSWTAGRRHMIRVLVIFNTLEAFLDANTWKRRLNEAPCVPCLMLGDIEDPF
jgi:hypothetical protein